MARKTVILIAGPTASGKTSLAIDLALSRRTAIISADSRQCYRELTIGVAKPSASQLSAVKHYFINSHSIQEEVTAAGFEQYALAALEEIWSYSDVAVMAGGTGLYIRAFCEGLDEIPPIPASLRGQIGADYRQHGLPWLQQEVSRHDPVYYRDGETLNPRRLMRALEIKLATGRSIRDWQQQKPVSRPFDIIKYAIDIPREQLYANIDTRVDRMMDAGLLEEVKALWPHRDLPALRTVGYTELFGYLEGSISLEQAVEQIKKNTRHYAKRQLTWFRKDKEIRWIQNGLQDIDP